MMIVTQENKMFPSPYVCNCNIVKLVSYFSRKHLGTSEDLDLQSQEDDHLDW